MFCRPEEKASSGPTIIMQYAPVVAVYGLDLSGVKGKHSFKDRTIVLAMSYATMGILVNTMKYSFREKRPDSPSHNSFPSGQPPRRS